MTLKLVIKSSFRLEFIFIYFIQVTFLCGCQFFKAKLDYEIKKEWIEMKKPPAGVEGRSLHSSIWTGKELIIWGGIGEDKDFFPPVLNSGAIFNFEKDSWREISKKKAPAPRNLHSAVWTGKEMIIWGGQGKAMELLNNGAAYNPKKNRWRKISNKNNPAARSWHSTVWTGTEMIVWGGLNKDSKLLSGGIYDPQANLWRETSICDSPNFHGRTGHTAIWTGNEMIVWGGYSPLKTNTGWRFDPKLNSWKEMSITNAPSSRSGHSAVWTGKEMIIWGGYGEDTLGDGGIYDPEEDKWRSITSDPRQISPRSLHVAIWIKSGMFIFGGRNSKKEILNSSFVYDPDKNLWQNVLKENPPSARMFNTIIYTGDRILIWGGFGKEEDRIKQLDSGFILDI